METRKNKNKEGYKYTDLPNVDSDIKLSISNTIRVLPDDHIILKKSKKVECLIIPAYVLNKNMNKTLTAITANIFSLRYSIKLIFTFKFFKKKCEIKIEKEMSEISIKKTTHLGIYLNSLILKTFPILQIKPKKII